MLEVAKVNARSLIALLKAVEAAHPQKRWIHVHLDNASYHHAKRVREWLKRQERKCVLHFIPPYCPHLDPIERCWGLMHQYTTHNRRLQNLRPIPRSDPHLPRPDNSQKMGAFPRPNQRQLPRHITGRFSDRRSAGEYQENLQEIFLSVSSTTAISGLESAAKFNT